MHADLAPIIRANLAREARLMTDKPVTTGSLARSLPATKRSTIARTNTSVAMSIPTRLGYYSIFKRMKGVYQHCKEKHLHRYLSEFHFRYSNRVRLGVDDVECTEIAIKGIVGKRLTYR